MSKTLNFRPKLSSAGGLGMALLGLLFLTVPGIVSAWDGAEGCGSSGCHEDKYSEWVTSGHHFILMEGQDAKHRAVPLPEGKTWDDFSYAIGGHRTRALYLTNTGNIYAPARGENQYNVLTGEWTNYREGETVAYDCGSCHTTGYNAGGSMSGLPGISGSFALPGVQCEACHGGEGEMGDADTDAAFCGTCHRNNANDNVITASNGFINSEGQYNELLAGAHASKDCVDCHNPHKSAELGIKQECSSCHSGVATSFAATSMADYGVECKDCHMPYATLSAQPLGLNQGDTRTHIFRINTDPNANMFTQDGTAVALTNGEAAVTLDFACKRCHETAAKSELAKFAEDFHNANKTLDGIGFNPGLSGTWWNSARSGEGFLLEVGYAGSQLYFFASFYTYDSLGNQIFLFVSGSIPNNDISLPFTVTITDGAAWGDNFNPNDVNRVTWGTGTFTFSTCTTGTISLVPSADQMALGYTTLEYAITRDLITAGITCPTFVNNAP